jgi:hypothetical protein
MKFSQEFQIKALKRLRLDHLRWQPFYEKFKHGERSLFDAYFFPFGLIKNPNLSKAEIYGYLREQWKEKSSPGEIIDELAKYQSAFIDLVAGTNHQQQKAPIRDAIHRLYYGCPVSCISVFDASIASSEG